MNDSVNAVAASAVPAQPPSKRGDDPPSGAFETALGSAAATESPPPGTTATKARTAAAEGKKAEGDSSGHTTTGDPVGPDQTYPASATMSPLAALLAAPPAPVGSPSQAPAATANPAPSPVDPRGANTSPAPATLLTAATPAPAAPQPTAAPPAAPQPATTPPAAQQPATAPARPAPVVAPGSRPAQAASSPAPAPAGTPSTATGPDPLPGAATPAGAADAVQQAAGTTAGMPAPAAAPAKSKPTAATVRPAQATGTASTTTSAVTGHAGAAARPGMANGEGQTDQRRPHSEGVPLPVPPATSASQEPAAEAGTAQAPSAGAQAPAAGQASTGGDAGRTDLASAAPAPAAPAAPSTAARPDSADSATATAHARMQDLADVTGATMRMAVRSGQPVARITLHPDGLGDVQVTMRYHQDGVSAIVTTDNHEAAQALIQAGADLRRSLEAHGVTVHGLDVHLSGDDGGANARGERASDLADAMGPTGGDDAADDEAEITIQPSQLPLPGSQIDVFA